MDLSGQMKDLSSRIEAMEDHQKEMESSPTSLNTSRTARKRANHRGSPNLDQDVAEEVCRHVAKRMRQMPVYSGATAEEDSTSEVEDQPAPWRRN